MLCLTNDFDFIGRSYLSSSGWERYEPAYENSLMAEWD